MNYLADVQRGLKRQLGEQRQQQPVAGKRQRLCRSCGGPRKGHPRSTCPTD